MKFQQVAIIIGLVAGAVCLAPVRAADAPPQPQQGAQSEVVQKALKQDAICTRCHDESEPKPILSLYQTKHGNRADGRTPTCQSCHGDSEKHLKGDPAQKGRARPDHIFGTKTQTYVPDPAGDQSGQCLTCHQSGLRMHWSGSQHESRDIPCASCHTVHAKKDPILVKASQAEVCFSCHKSQRADTHKISTHPLDAGKMSCSDCHNPHGSSGPKLLVKNTVNEAALAMPGVPFGGSRQEHL